VKPRSSAALFLILAATQTHAQNSDYMLPDGSIVHRHVMASQQCLRLGTDPHGFDWDHDGPCSGADFAEIDAGHHIIYRKDLTKADLEKILASWALIQYGDRRLKAQIAVGNCMHLPADEAASWFHQPPCLPTDLGKITQNGKIAFRGTASRDQLQYTIALFIHTWTGMPITMTDFPQYHGHD
jgi:hypothetical protein